MAETHKPKVLLFGVGSIGAVYLYQLQQAKCEVTAVCRSNYERVKEHGFHLKSLRFGDQIYKPDHITRSVEEVPHDTIFDYILVTTKVFPDSKPTLADMIRPAAEKSEKTAIVLAQNGIDIEKDIAAAYPQNPIISGVIYCPATQTEPGVIEYTEMLNCLEMGTYPANAPAFHKQVTEAFAQLMIKGGGGAKVFDNVQVARWSKLLHNGPWNPICALTLCTDGGFLSTSDPYAYELVWDIMMEIIQLAKKLGVPGVDEDMARERVSIALNRAKTRTGREMSMLQDVKQDRPLEVEAIIGNPVRLGRQHGVPMPRLETLYALAKARNVALTQRGPVV